MGIYPERAMFYVLGFENLVFFKRILPRESLDEAASRAAEQNDFLG